jgi:hypothetical protein
MPTQLALSFDAVPVTCEVQQRYHSIAPVWPESALRRNSGMAKLNDLVQGARIALKLKRSG